MKSAVASPKESSQFIVHSSQKIDVNIAVEKSATDIHLQQIIVQEKITSNTVSSEPLSVNLVEEPRINSSSNKPKKELPRQSALGAMMKEIHKENIVKKTEDKIELNEETVLPLWKEFLAENKERLQNAFLSVAEKQTPQYIEEKITFIETNNISLELLQLHKIDIVSYFMKRTTSSFVRLDFKLNRKESISKNYKTPRDRLKDMIAQNPSVLKLIEKFDLNND